MTDTDHETRGFPPIKAVRAPPELDRFATAVRRLQDLTVSTNPHGPLWTAAAERVEDVCALLEAHEVPEGAAPAGRATNLPGLGHPLLPPWSMTDSGADGVTMRGHFTAYHRGGNNAVHGGVIPLFFDWHFGMIVSAAGRPISRTAYLHVDYRTVTPIDKPLLAHGRITSIEGRKAYITATMTTCDGTVLSEANGLMIQLLAHQP
jgi:acyl-coenzyme A thioesterase PaaI-like protein